MSMSLCVICEILVSINSGLLGSSGSLYSIALFSHNGLLSMCKGKNVNAAVMITFTAEALCKKIIITQIF